MDCLSQVAVESGTYKRRHDAATQYPSLLRRAGLSKAGTQPDVRCLGRSGTCDARRISHAFGMDKNVLALVGLQAVFCVRPARTDAQQTNDALRWVDPPCGQVILH